MSGSFNALTDHLLFFACLSDRAYDLGEGQPHGSNRICDPLLRDLAIEHRHPAVEGRDGEKADYIIVRRLDEQYVAIRGTNPKLLEDVITDASLRKPPNDDPLVVRMHSGFRAYARAVLQDLRTEKLLDPHARTFVTGHSLGGAAALIVALELQFSQDANIVSVFTYGQPRVFDNAGATAWPEFSRRTYRVVSCRDPVPMVPRGDGLLDNIFAFRLFGGSAADYQHMGQEILLMDEGAYWIAGDVEVWRDYRTNVDGLFRDLLDGRTIDHAIRTYEERIEAATHAGASGPHNPGFEGRCGAVSPRLPGFPALGVAIAARRSQLD